VRLSRWVNILFGVVYTLVMVAVVALARGWYFYTMYGLIEIILSLLVAWTWPKEAATGSSKCGPLLLALHYRSPVRQSPSDERSVS